MAKSIPRSALFEHVRKRISARVPMRDRRLRREKEKEDYLKDDEIEIKECKKDLPDDEDK